MITTHEDWHTRYLGRKRALAEKSCKLLLDVIQGETDSDIWTLPQYHKALCMHHTPHYVLCEALAGRIRSHKDARIALATARLLGQGTLDLDLSQIVKPV